MKGLKKAACGLSVVAMLVAGAGCESDGNGDASQEVTSIGEQPRQGSLYQRIGGEGNLRRVVDDYLNRMMADPQMNFAQRMQQHSQGRGVGMANRDVSQLRERYFNFIASAIGGGTEYRGEPIAQVHQGMNIDQQQFDAALRHFQAAMRANGVQEKEEQELLKVLRGVRPAVVQEAGKGSK